ncbi:unnamed protein product [Prunus brigantina]
MQIQHKSTIGWYLGISNIVFWKDPLNAKNMVERIKGKFAGWKAQTLSRAGILTLIKASVSGIPNHSLSCFKCPSEMQDSYHHPQAAFLKKMWVLKVPPKVKIFSWLLIRKRLQVRGHLHRFLPQINPECPFCNIHRETIPHLFSTCHFAQSIWSCTSMAPGITSPNFDFLTWLGSLLTTPNSSSPKLFCYAGRFGKQGIT